MMKPRQQNQLFARLTACLVGLVVVLALSLIVSPTPVLAQGSCGGGKCAADACGLESLDYGGYFNGDGVPSLICFYDPSCPEAGKKTVPCPADCTGNYANNPGCGIPNAWNGVCFEGGGDNGCIGNQRCRTENNSEGCFTNIVEVFCSGGCTPSPSPGGGDGGGGGTPPPGATATPTPVPPRNFYGNFYLDANAVTMGLGGTDNLCTGSTASPVSLTGATSVTAVRAGETSNGLVGGTSYSITTSTSNSDYTVTLELPFPPPDPENAYQCACNADPTDPYRCIYTNRQPSNTQQVNFFVKLANTTNTAWWQALGGSTWAAHNIQSLIPEACVLPGCKAALIGSDPVGTTDSAGFPLSGDGQIVTSSLGGTFIHESSERSNAVQAKGLGVTVPVENYQAFFAKVGGRAQVLPNAGKPIVGSDLAVYVYNGNLTITQDNVWNVANNEKIIVFVDGNMTINDTSGGAGSRIITVAAGGDGFLMFIVKGDLTIGAGVGYTNIATNPAAAGIANVEGVFVADGIFRVEGTPGQTDRKFIGAGTFVGWSGVSLERNFDGGGNPTLNNNAATETFIFRPDLLVNTPKEIQSAQMVWREVAPQF